MKFKLYIPVLSVMLLAIACNSNNPAYEPQELLIHTESKWLIDNRSEQKINIISFKEYDNIGNLIQSNEYTEKGIIKLRINFSYNSNQHTEEVTTFSDGVESDIHHNTYHLNSNGKVVERVSQDHHGDTIDIIRYNYDLNGNIIEESTFSKDGTLKGKTSFVYEYNSQGFIVGRIVDNDLLNGFETKDTLIYKTETKVVERFSYNSLGNLEVIYTYHYNNNGKVVKEVLSDRNGNVIKKYKFEYTYF